MQYKFTKATDEQHKIPALQVNGLEMLAMVRI